MLKWTSESEYFLSFEIFFADTIYHIQSKSNHFTPSAAHARRGVIIMLHLVYGSVLLSVRCVVQQPIGKIQCRSSAFNL